MMKGIDMTEKTWLPDLEEDIIVKFDFYHAPYMMQMKGAVELRGRAQARKTVEHLNNVYGPGSHWMEDTEGNRIETIDIDSVLESVYSIFNGEIE
jgi:hypothetical protein